MLIHGRSSSDSSSARSFGRKLPLKEPCRVAVRSHMICGALPVSHWRWVMGAPFLSTSTR